MSRTLVTGHTGFKGSWLVHRLAADGRAVIGYSLPPTRDSHYVKAETHQYLEEEIFGDVRDTKLFDEVVESVKPTEIIHFAAQAIVSVSTSDPFGTISANVEGTNAVIATSVKHSVPRLLVVTSDKVYRDSGGRQASVESSELGGYDPYSSSKAAADMIAQSWARTQNTSVISIVRGGNVIGGGDRGVDRLIPDFERAVSTNAPLTIRNPHQVRPWQHVLDCIDGYLTVLDQKLAPQGEAWNVGPPIQGSEPVTVKDLLEIYAEARGTRPQIRYTPSQIRETNFLSIDTSKIARELSWAPFFEAKEAISETALWESRVARGLATASEATTEQLRSYLLRRAHPKAKSTYYPGG